MRPSSESLSVRRREAGRAEVKAVGRCRAVTGLNPFGRAGWVFGFGFGRLVVRALQALHEGCPVGKAVGDDGIEWIRKE